jgi:hypothetical protein
MGQRLNLERFHQVILFGAIFFPYNEGLFSTSLPQFLCLSQFSVTVEKMFDLVKNEVEHNFAVKYLKLQNRL